MPWPLPMRAGRARIITSCSAWPAVPRGRRSRRRGGAGPGPSIPIARPGQAGDAAAGRFRALAEAYRVLSDPGRRAAYDRALARGQAAGVPAAVSVPVRRARPGGVTGLSPVPGPPLRAGPVRVDGPHPATPPDGWDEDDIRLAVLAELALWYLARDRGRPW